MTAVQQAIISKSMIDYRTGDWLMVLVSRPIILMLTIILQVHCKAIVIDWPKQDYLFMYRNLTARVMIIHNAKIMRRNSRLYMIIRVSGASHYGDISRDRPGEIIPI